MFTRLQAWRTRPAVHIPPADVVAPHKPFCNCLGIPDSCRMAEVIPVGRGGIGDDGSNYHPLSLLSVVLEVLERCIQDKKGR